MSKITGMTIDGKHTSELGLKLVSFYIPLPPVNTNIIEVPGLSGGIDATEVAAGYPTYAMRKGLKFTFKAYSDWDDFETVKSRLAAWIHGKKVKVILDSDVAYYYICRLEVDAKKTNRLTSVIEISGIAEPMKYDVLASNEEWLWDPFDFNDGIIRDLANLEVAEDGTEVTIFAGSYPTSPVFIVSESTNLSVVYEGYEYSLPVGEICIPKIEVGDTDVTLIFNGQGKLDISYRGERL